MTQFTQFDMFRKAIEQLGPEVENAKLIEFFQKQFGVKLDPKYIPILWATRRGQDALRQSRENATKILAEVEKEKPAKKKRREQVDASRTPAS